MTQKNNRHPALDAGSKRPTGRLMTYETRRRAFGCRIKCGMTALVFIFSIFSLAAHAEDMKYIADPIYQSFDPHDTSPMQEMIDLANTGDIRAQYILGDLYSKGKGGLEKNEKKGAEWFEIAAKNGYFESFIRLAALAKHRGKYVDAYKWYTLAMRSMDSGPWRDHASDARDALEKSHKFTVDEYDEARKQINIWRSAARHAEEDEAERQATAAKQRKKELDAIEKKLGQKGKISEQPKPVVETPAAEKPAEDKSEEKKNEQD